MAVDKVIAGNDVVHGLAVVGGGEANPMTYNNRDRTRTLANHDSLAETTNWDSRYLVRVGGSGSGNWEH